MRRSYKLISQRRDAPLSVPVAIRYSCNLNFIFNTDPCMQTLQNSISEGECNLSFRIPLACFSLSSLCLIVGTELCGSLVRAGPSAHPPSIHCTKNQSLISNRKTCRSRVYVHSSLNEDVGLSHDHTISRGRNCRRSNHHSFKSVPLSGTRALFRVPTITLTMIMWLDSTCALSRLKTASLADSCLSEPVY